MKPRDREAQPDEVLVGAWQDAGMIRIDAHRHLWDIDARPQPWMTGRYTPMARSFLSDDYAAVALPCGVRSSVVVQSVSETAETDELLAVSAIDPFIGGVIGWVDLTKPDVSDQLQRFRANLGGEHLVGIRHQVHDEPDVDWLARPAVRRGLAAVGEAGLSYDLLIRTEHLEVASDTARTVHGTHFVIDHAAKPPIEHGDLEPWRTGIRALAALPNVSCKLSGLVTEASWETWTPADLGPWVDTVLDAFGPERTMVGSDWPLCTLACAFDVSLEVYGVQLAGLSRSDQDALHAGTAQRVYGLPS